MLRGRSARDSVLPSGEAPYSSTEASWVGMLLERVILGGPPMGLGATGRCGVKQDKRLLIVFNNNIVLSTQSTVFIYPFTLYNYLKVYNSTNGPYNSIWFHVLSES